MKGSISAGRASIMIAGVLIASCAPRVMPTEADDSPPASAQEVVDPSIVPPAGLAPNVLRVHEHEARQRANLSLDQIVASLPREAYDAIARGGKRVPADAESADAPLLFAQKRYLAARMKWRRELRYDAIEELKAASNRVSGHAPIHRFLGLIYDEQGNAGQSFASFQRAAGIDPKDPYTKFMLCRLLVRQGRWEVAIVGLAELAESAAGESRLGFLPLVSANLGDALWREGYDLAAIEQWRTSLEQQIRFERLAGSLRNEAIARHRERGLIWQRIGDAYHRIGRPLEALDAYSRAAPYSANGRSSMIRRLTCTFLRIGRTNLARQAVIDRLATGRIETRDLALVDYLVSNGVDKDTLVPPLRRITLDRDRPPVLVLTVARLLEHEPQVAWLRAHLEARPADRHVYEQLIALHFANSGDLDGAVEAIRTTVATISAFPKATDAYVGTLIRRAGTLEVLINAMGLLEADEYRQPMAQYLRGRVFSEAGVAEQAMAAYREAIQAGDGVVEARLALANLLIDRDRLEEAMQVLQPISQVPDDRVLALRLRVLARMGRTSEALRLLDEAIVARPNSEPLVLRKAALERESGNMQAAEFALRGLFSANPSSHRAYEALIDLYIEEQPPGWNDRVAKLYPRLRKYLPHARVTRRETARMQLRDSEGDHAQVEVNLRKLLQEERGDYRSARLLLRLLIATERTDEAEILLEEQLVGAPPPPEVRKLAERFFVELALHHHDQGEFDKTIDMVDRAVQKPINDPRALRALIEIQRLALLALDKVDLIEPKLRAAIERFPDLEAPLLLRWAMMLEHRNDHERSEQIMIELLEKFPEDADTNNSLGYTWADRNQRLEEAERMIKIAVAVEPQNPAYLDSLGWVYYKLGRFDDAVECLSKAMMQPGGRDPVILDHLGDALFRLQRTDEAVRYWQDALNGVSNMPLNSETRKIPVRVQKKITALKAKQSVPVAEAPGAE